MPGGSGFSFGSRGALRSSAVGGSQCAPEAHLPVWSYPPGISLHTPGLLQIYTQAQRVGVTGRFP